MMSDQQTEMRQRVDRAVHEAAPEAHGAAAAGSGQAPVTLFQFPLVWGRNVSPFALKLETWLKLAEIPCNIQDTMSFGKAPKGKIPYIQDGDELIGDSSLIIEHLKATRGIDPDIGLSERERSESLALQRLFEEHFYFILVWSRWIDPAGWAVTREVFFQPLPALVRPVARAGAQYKVSRMLHQQGIGRHRPDEIHALARDDLRAIAGLLEERPFFMGDRLTGIDAVAFGFLANILLVPVETELKRMTQEFGNLVGWVEAMEAGLNAER
jgi:glutathione S-transferase